ncbi:MAG: L,D-transpeptidase family protein [Planctomycetota bacterium]
MQSQSPRTGMSRRNMTSRRKGVGRLPKVLALVGCVVLLVFFFWKDDSPSASGTSDGASGNAGQHAAGRADTPPESLASTDLPGLRGPVAQKPPAVIDPPASGSDAAEPTPPTAAPASLPTPPAPPEADPGVAQAVRDLTESLPSPQRFSSSADAATLYNRGDRLIADGDPIAGRAILSRLLFADNLQLSAQDADAVRARLDEVNRRLFWSPEIILGDTVTKPYPVDGQFLSRIGVKHRVPYQLLETVNNLSARNLRGDQTVKVVQGPLHARVTKHRFVMDVYALDPEGMPVYLKSFPVGLGENTPAGNWQVTKASKVQNPSWRDELNGEFFAADNPENPVGEYWIAIHGLDDANRGKRGFGIHGTIEPESIGTNASRGCVRLADDDIALVYQMLTDHSQGSTVQIVP